MYESCENYINVTYNAIKSAGVKELCIYLNNNTYPVELQIYLISDVILRIMNFKIDVERISILINKK